MDATASANEHPKCGKPTSKKMTEFITPVDILDYFTSFYSCSRSLISSYGVDNFDDFNAPNALKNTASYNATPYALFCIINIEMLFGLNKH